MSSQDPLIKDHQAWLGYIQEGSSGLVVSPAALADSQVLVNRNAIELQEAFREQLAEVDDPETGIKRSVIADATRFLREFLAWPDDCLAGIHASSPVPDELSFHLREYQEELRPTFAFRDPQPQDPARPWLILGVLLNDDEDLDAPHVLHRDGWQASPTQRLERLLRETKHPIGLLVHREAVRLLYAPHGENSGYLTFPIGPMVEVAGRPILAAMEMLLGKVRLLTGPRNARLPALLALSREYQANVSTKLAKQVLDSLYELLRGFEAANRRAHGTMLEKVLADDPNQVYRGLLTVLMRLVFLLYAEDRGIMPDKALYQRNYGIHDLYVRLRDDAERHPDTMDERYGAWPRLLALFRAIHDGCKHPDLKMPPRRGHLFDPDRFPFLEGRTTRDQAPGALPLVPDGVVHRVLQNLLILDGERLSYRTLDVEQIGSVYETMMGFRLEIAAGPSIAIKPGKKMGAPAIVDLDALLAAKPAERAKALTEATGRKFEGKVAGALKDARTVEDILAALDRAIARNATPHVLPRGAMALQPTDERRRSGSHYTPRKLTEPIVRKTLEPVLARLGDNPTPAQILDLKVADIAMGSGAFLVEACRQLAEVLVKAWHAHRALPFIPPDETEYLCAMRIVAQRCLYGVDKNPMAVDLAKLSLWLATLAKDHPFTFLDHSLRHGDSLVGLTREQIANFTWETGAKQRVLGDDLIEKRLDVVMKFRREILDGDDEFQSPALKRQKLDKADEQVDYLRDIADLVIEAFFAESKDKARKQRLAENQMALLGEIKTRRFAFESLKRLEGLRSGPHAMKTFHWQIEFPEVFDRENSGFDAIVGNPPFLGGLKVSALLGMAQFEFLTASFPGAGHTCDYVAYFFRKAFASLRSKASMGLVATNSIAQGDTREGGLTWICNNGGAIYSAMRRLRWPGEAAVIVSVLHIAKDYTPRQIVLDGCLVSRLTAYLFTKGESNNPTKLEGLNELFSQGVNIRSPGFLIGDSGEATSLDEMRELLRASPRSQSRIREYIGGEEVNQSPDQSPRRYVIYLSDIVEEDELAEWQGLAEIVRRKVKPERDALGSNPNNIPLKKRWWAYHAERRDFYRSMAECGRVLVMSQVSSNHALVFGPPDRIYGNTLNLFLLPTFSAFAALQSRPHEVWARFFASSMKDDLRYTPSDCFETFPFPPDFETDPALEAAGKAYYEFRADLMVRHDEGLTATYNRFHDPAETNPDILRLRELHAAMDCAVLHAYGWDDIKTDCDFFLDYEDDEDDAEDGKTRRKKKPWRYRWPDHAHDEVLARLLALNAERAKQEEIAGTAKTGTKGGAKTKAAKKAAKGTRAAAPGKAEFFGEEEVVE